MNKFPKKERLSSKIDIDELFKSKNTFTQDKIKVYWNENSSNTGHVSVLFSVPKKIVSLATKRNKIKRLLKESYRINKKMLQKTEKEIRIAFVYLCTETPNFNSIEEKIKLILQRLNNQI